MGTCNYVTDTEKHEFVRTCRIDSEYEDQPLDGQLDHLDLGAEPGPE